MKFITSLSEVGDWGLNINLNQNHSPTSIQTKAHLKPKHYCYPNFIQNLCPNNIEIMLLATTFHLAIVNEMLTLPCNYCYETCFYKLILFSQSSLVISFDFLNQKEITDNITRYWSVLLTFLSHNLIFTSLYSNYMRKKDATYPMGPPTPI